MINISANFEKILKKVIPTKLVWVFLPIYFELYYLLFEHMESLHQEKYIFNSSGIISL